MKKYLIIFLGLNIFITAFANNSLANKVCDKYFTILQKVFNYKILEERPFIKTLDVFNSSTTFLDGMDETVPQSKLMLTQMFLKKLSFKDAYEKASICYHLLCNDLDQNLSDTERAQLSAEFAFAFNNQSSGYMDRLFGLESLDKISIQNCVDMGQQIYNDFIKLLSMGEALESFVAEQPVFPVLPTPTTISFSLNDPQLAFLNPELFRNQAKFELLTDQPSFVQSANKHWSKKCLKRILAEQGILTGRIDALAQECKLHRDYCLQKLENARYKRNLLVGRFNQVNTVPVVVCVSNLITTAAYAYCITSISTEAFPSLKNAFVQKLETIGIAAPKVLESKFSTVFLDKDVSIVAPKTSLGVLQIIAQNQEFQNFKATLQEYGGLCVSGLITLCSLGTDLYNSKFCNNDDNNNDDITKPDLKIFMV